MEAMIRQRLAEISKACVGSLCGDFHLSLVSYDLERNEFLFSCKTTTYMRNPIGTLHGGICASILDHAMGVIAYCLNNADAPSPTINLSVAYHRPLVPGNHVYVRTRLLSVTKSLISLSAECSQTPDFTKVATSASATFFRK